MKTWEQLNPEQKRELVAKYGYKPSDFVLDYATMKKGLEGDKEALYKCLNFFYDSRTLYKLTDGKVGLNDTWPAFFPGYSEEFYDLMHLVSAYKKASEDLFMKYLNNKCFHFIPQEDTAIAFDTCNHKSGISDFLTSSGLKVEFKSYMLNDTLALSEYQTKGVAHDSNFILFIAPVENSDTMLECKLVSTYVKYWKMYCPEYVREFRKLTIKDEQIANLLKLIGCKDSIYDFRIIQATKR